MLSKTIVVSRDVEIQNLARQVSKQTFVADDATEALDIAATVHCDFVLVGAEFNPETTFDLIRGIKTISTNVPVVIVGQNHIEAEISEKVRLTGAYDYLRSKEDLAKLRQIAIQIAEKVSGTDTHAGDDCFFIDELARSVSFVGQSKATCDTLELIGLVATSECNPVLITGETGTGKELAAQAVHALRNPGKAFVAVNCAALTASLLESELFGHVKGSFTGAEREKTGLMELAADGTLFLDEISEMPTDLQAKLLRVLQEKTFRKVGGVEDIPCKATIITSSNRNLFRETRAKRFRQDLHYRLNICPVIIPPLRAEDRREDIVLLAEYFLKSSTICPAKVGKIRSFTKLALEALQQHIWPGNVRELRNVIERAILLERTDKIGLNSIRIDPGECHETTNGFSTPHSLQIEDFSLAKAECSLIARALQQTGWQKTKAAALLGITRATLYAKVKQYNIEKKPADSNKQSNNTAVTYQPVSV